MNAERLQAWLDEYGRAWEAKNTRAFVGLFTPNTRYFWTPFGEPKRGHEELAIAFEGAVARQEQIAFHATVLVVNGRRGLAHWQCSFQRVGSDERVQLDGIFLMDFDDLGRCDVFREWWHSDEHTSTPIS